LIERLTQNTSVTDRHGDGLSQVRDNTRSSFRVSSYKLT